MDEPLSEEVDSGEATEARDDGDDGKKRSKFKAFKSFFGKKKKKEPEDGAEGATKHPSRSSSNNDLSSLMSLRGNRSTERSINKGMGTKALSHDSIFITEPEPERDTSAASSSPEFQINRPVKVSSQASSSPTLERFDKDSKDSDKDSSSGESLRKLPKKKPYHKTMTLRKKSPEKVSGPIRSQSLTTFSMAAGSTSKPSGFSSPASNQGCLDSSAARHKMALNPRKQKKKKKSQATVNPAAVNPTAVNLTATKPKKEGLCFLLTSEADKIINVPKRDEQNKSRKDSSGSFNQGQSSKTDTYDQEKDDQAPNTDEFENPHYMLTNPFSKGDERKGSNTSATSEGEPGSRSLRQSNHELDFGDDDDDNGDEDKSPSATKAPGECLFWHLLLEQHSKEEVTATQAENPPPQRKHSDTDDTGQKDDVGDVDTRSILVSQFVPQESGGPTPPTHTEDVTPVSGGESSEASASFLSVVESLSATQGEDIFSMVMDTQLFVNPSPFPSEREAVSDLYLQTLPSICAENTLEDALEVCTNSILAEGRLSPEKPPQEGLSWLLEKLEPEIESPDSDIMAEVEDSDFEQQPALASASQCLGAPKDAVEVFHKAEIQNLEASPAEQQSTPSYTLQYLGQPETEEGLLDSEAASEEGSDFASQLTPIDSFQSLEKLDDQEDLTEFKRLCGDLNISEEQTPTHDSKALEESEDEASSESNSYTEKYESAAGWSTSEEDLFLENSSQASGSTKDLKDASTAPTAMSEEQGALEELNTPRDDTQPFARLKVSQVSQDPKGPSTKWRNPVKMMLPKYPFQSWMNPKLKHQVFPGFKNTSVEWGISVSPLSPSVLSRSMTNPRMTEEDTASPKMETSKGAISTSLLPSRSPASSPVKFKIKKDISAEPEDSGSGDSDTVGSSSLSRSSSLNSKSRLKLQATLDPKSAVGSNQCTSKDLMTLRRHLKPWASPKTQQKVLFPSSVSLGGRFPRESLLERGPSQSSGTTFPKQNALQEASGVTAECLPSQASPMPAESPKAQKSTGNAPAGEYRLGRLLSFKCSTQTLVKPKFKPLSATLSSLSASGEQRNSEEAIPSKHTLQVPIGPRIQPQGSAEPENPPTNRGRSVQSVATRHYFQPWVSSVLDKPVTGGASKNTATDVSGPGKPQSPSVSSRSWNRPWPAESNVGTASSTSADLQRPARLLPPRRSFQSWLTPQFEQQIFAGLESAVAEKNNSMEKSTPRWTSKALLGKLDAQMPPSAGLNSLTLDEGNQNDRNDDGISPEPLPSRHSSRVIESLKPSGFQIFSGEEDKPVLRRFSQQLQLRTEAEPPPSLSAAMAESMSESPQDSSKPLQSFVKFMAENVFAQTPVMTGGACVNPLPPNPPPKPSLNPKVESRAVGAGNNVTAEDGSVLKYPLKSLNKVEHLREIYTPCPQSTPTKWSAPKEQLPPKPLAKALGKVETQQQVSPSSLEGSRDLWKQSEAQASAREIFQAEPGAAVQAKNCFKGSMTPAREQSTPEERQSSRKPVQSFLDSKYPKPAFSSPMGGSKVEVTMPEGQLRSWAHLKAPPVTTKTKQHSRSSEDLVRNTLDPYTRPTKFTTSPVCQTFVSETTLSKKEVFESGDPNDESNPSFSSREADVQNLFGIRLRKVPPMQQNVKEKSDNLVKTSSVSALAVPAMGRSHPIRRSVSQGYLDAVGNHTNTSKLEKQQIRPKSEMFDKKPPNVFPAKPPALKAEQVTPEPPWKIVVKQRQKRPAPPVPVRGPQARNKIGSKTEAKQFIYRGATPAYIKPGKNLTYKTPKQEKVTLKPFKPTKTGGVGGKKFQLPTKEKETRRAPTLPAKFPVSAEETEHDEPVWFSLAKEKAKAWSQIAETMQ